MHSCDAAKDVRIADEGSEEVHSVHSHMPWRRRLHHSRIISLVKPHKDPLPAYTLLLQPAQHPAQYARTNLQHISCAFTSCLRPRCSIRAPACIPIAPGYGLSPSVFVSIALCPLNQVDSSRSSGCTS